SRARADARDRPGVVGPSCSIEPSTRPLRRDRAADRRRCGDRDSFAPPSRGSGQQRLTSWPAGFSRSPPSALESPGRLAMWSATSDPAGKARRSSLVHPRSTSRNGSERDEHELSGPVRSPHALAPLRRAVKRRIHRPIHRGGDRILPCISTIASEPMADPTPTTPQTEESKKRLREKVDKLLAKDPARSTGSITL